MHAISDRGECKSSKRGCIKSLGEAKFLVESVWLWFTAEEFLEGSHFILASSLFEDGVAVATTFFLVHGVIFEDGVEHVGGVYLGAARC